MFSVIDNAPPALEKFLHQNNIMKLSVKKQITQLRKDVLKKYGLRKTDRHKTGNYYRDTLFYRVIEHDEVPDFLKRTILNKDTRQLNLPL